MLCVFISTLLLALSVVVKADLRSDLTGRAYRVVFPGDPGYDAVRQSYNRRYDFYPAAIAFPTTVPQVASIVNAGYRNHVHVSALSGGHSYIANGLGDQNGSLVVDMGSFNTTTVNADTTATIGSGCTMGNIAIALGSRGRAFPEAYASSVGMGGYSAYGGYSLASRMWGLAIDNILSIEVVLANGTVVSASRSVRPNLFWALRGAAPSFGITTYIQVKTYPVPPSVVYFDYGWTMSARDVASAFINYQTFTQTNAPPNLGCSFNLYRAEPGIVAFELTGNWYGPADQFPGVILPFLRTLPPNYTATIQNRTYISDPAFVSTIGRTTSRDTFYARSLMIPQSAPLELDNVLALTGYLASVGARIFAWSVEIQLWGGPNSAINNVQSDATAFPHRNELFTIQIYVSEYNGGPVLSAENSNFVDDVESILEDNNIDRWGYNPGAYLNYIEDSFFATGLRTRYYESAYPRLSNLKAAYDPTDVFSFPNGVELPTPFDLDFTPLEIHPNGNLAKCVDVQGNTNFTNGSLVQIYDCDMSLGQRWLITRGDAGHIRLEGTNYCLDAGSSPANGVRMKIWTCYDNLPAQSWVYWTDNTIRLASQNQCLNLVSGDVTNGNAIQTWECNPQNTHQLWTI